MTDTLAPTEFAADAKHLAQPGVAGKYMTFKLGEEHFAIQASGIRELIRLGHITKIPRTKPFIRGLINLRGKVLPILDVRIKLGMAEVKATQQTVVIVIEYPLDDEVLTLGLVVDEVLELVYFRDPEIEPAPKLGPTCDTSFLLGVGKTDPALVFLLNTEKLISIEEAMDIAVSTAS